MDTDAKKTSRWLLFIPAVLIFVFFYPRLLISWLGESNPWTSYLYQYTFGLVFFGSGLLLITKSGACRFDRGHDAFWFKSLVWGFVFFASLHAFWVYLSLAIPVKGLN